MAATKTELHDIVESMPEELAAKVLPMLRDSLALAAAADRYRADRERVAQAAARVIADHELILKELAK
jgi:hypothetical protein